ncbi:hypothetical protein FB451DRAFT_1273269 [Mycena latifolia]|nr:hypothetical protein FB451DRAFT_1273269 [Mycena latifolia]
MRTPSTQLMRTSTRGGSIQAPGKRRRRFWASSRSLPPNKCRTSAKSLLADWVGIEGGAKRISSVRLGKMFGAPCRWMKCAGVVVRCLRQGREVRDKTGRSRGAGGSCGIYSRCMIVGWRMRKAFKSAVEMSRKSESPNTVGRPMLKSLSHRKFIRGRTRAQSDALSAGMRLKRATRPALSVMIVQSSGEPENLMSTERRTSRV